MTNRLKPTDYTVTQHGQFHVDRTTPLPDLVRSQRMSRIGKAHLLEDLPGCRDDKTARAKIGIALITLNTELSVKQLSALISRLGRPATIREIICASAEKTRTLRKRIAMVDLRSRHHNSAQLFSWSDGSWRLQYVGTERKLLRSYSYQYAFVPN